MAFYLTEDSANAYCDWFATLADAGAGNARLQFTSVQGDYSAGNILADFTLDSPRAWGVPVLGRAQLSAAPLEVVAPNTGDPVEFRVLDGDSVAIWFGDISSAGDFTLLGDQTILVGNVVRLGGLDLVVPILQPPEVAMGSGTFGFSGVGSASRTAIAQGSGTLSPSGTGSAVAVQSQADFSGATVAGGFSSSGSAEAPSAPVASASGSGTFGFTATGAANPIASEGIGSGTMAFSAAGAASGNVVIPVVNFMTSGGTRSTTVPTDVMAPGGLTFDLIDTPGWDRRWLVYADFDEPGLITGTNPMTTCGGFPAAMEALWPSTWDANSDVGSNGGCMGFVWQTQGTKTVTLSGWTHDGQTISGSFQVSVAADGRTPLYVTPTGNDGNSGINDTVPIATLAEAETRVQGGDFHIFLERGQIHEGPTAPGEDALFLGTNADNVVISAYGAGAKPIVRDNAGPTFTNSLKNTACFNFFQNARCGIIDVQFRSSVDVFGAEPTTMNDLVNHRGFESNQGARHFLLNCEHHSDDTDFNPATNCLLHAVNPDAIKGLQLFNLHSAGNHSGTRRQTYVSNGVPNGESLFGDGNNRHQMEVGTIYGGTFEEHCSRHIGNNANPENHTRGFLSAFCAMNIDRIGEDADGRGHRLQGMQQATVYHNAYVMAGLEFGFDALDTAAFSGGPARDILVEGCVNRTGGQINGYDVGRYHQAGINTFNCTLRNGIAYMEDQARAFLNPNAGIGGNPARSGGVFIDDLEYLHCTVVNDAGAIGFGPTASPQAPMYCLNSGDDLNANQTWGPHNEPGNPHDGVLVTNLTTRGLLSTAPRPGHTGSFQAAYDVRGQSYPNGGPRPSIDFGPLQYNVWPTSFVNNFVWRSGGSDPLTTWQSTVSQSDNEIQANVTATELEANGMLPPVASPARTHVPPDLRIQVDVRGALRNQDATNWPAGAVGLETP